MSVFHEFHFWFAHRMNYAQFAKAQQSLFPWEHKSKGKLCSTTRVNYWPDISTHMVKTKVKLLVELQDNCASAHNFCLRVELMQFY